MFSTSRLKGVGVVLAVALLAGCTSEPMITAPTVGPEGGTVQLTDSIELTVPAAAVDSPTIVSAETVAEQDPQSPAQPLMVGSNSVLSPWEQELPPVRLSASNSFNKPVTLKFKVRPNLPAPPVLLTRGDSAVDWQLIASQYDPQAGLLQAEVTHFSKFNALSWIEQRADALLKAIWDDMFGYTTATADPPRCDNPPKAVFAVQTQGGDALGWCVESLRGDEATVRLVNRRRYPVDILSDRNSRVVVEDKGSTFAQLGATVTRAVSNGQGITLLPGGKTGTVVVHVSENDKTKIRVALDQQAYLFGVLDVQLRFMALILGKLRLPGTSSTELLGRLAGQLAPAKCLHQALTSFGEPVALTPEVAAALGTTISRCASSIFTDSTIVLLAGIWALIFSVVDVVLLQSGRGLVDARSGNMFHELQLTRMKTVITFRGYGLLTVGMTQNEAMAASPVPLQEQNGNTQCVFLVDLSGGRDTSTRLQVEIPRNTGKVIGIHAPVTATTDRGIRVGATREAVRAAYPDRVIEVPEPDDPFRRLTADLVQRWPDAPPYGGLITDPVPHLTITHGASSGEVAEVEADVTARLPFTCPIHEAWLIGFDGTRWARRASLPLGVARPA